MEARAQRRIQRYGWDLAADTYEPLWHVQLARVQAELLALAAPGPGEYVLDLACGTGLVTFETARAVGVNGWVLGIDLSGQMVDSAQKRVLVRKLSNVSFARMDAEALALPDHSFDVTLCALGLMYMPNPGQALREARRVLRPGGRMVIAVWGERSSCGWSALFPIVDAEVSSDVCPLFFGLGQTGALANLCVQEGFEVIEQRRIATTLIYANGDEACNAAFVGGPVALAWSRFSEKTRANVRARYLDAIEPWRDGEGYRMPGEFVVVSAVVPNAH